MFVNTIFDIMCYSKYITILIIRGVNMVYNNNIDDIMKLIKHIMIDNDIKQTDIVEKTGQSKSTISNLLNGKSKNITLDTLLMLCNAVGCQLEINIKPKNKY